MENKEKKKPDLKKIFIICGIVLIILALVFSLAGFLTDYSGNSSKKNDSVEGLFYHVNSDSVKDFTEFGNGVAILTNNTVQYLDASGNLMASNQHSFADPAMYVAGKNMLLYDKGGSGLRLEKNSSVFKELTLESSITCAALGKSNYYAYSLNEDAGYQSHVSVCSFAGKVVFEWGSASDYCLSLCLSDDCKKLAVSVVGVDNAEYFSKVLLFDIPKKEMIYETVFDEKTVFRIDFINSKELAVFTDSGLFRSDNEGNVSPIYEYASTELNNVSLSDNGFKIISIAPYGNEQTPTVIVFNKKFNELFRHEYDSAISDVFCNKNYVCVAQNDVIKVINRDNTVIGNFRLDEKCENVVLIGRNIFLLTASGISKFDVSYSNNSNDEAEEVTKKIYTDDETISTASTTENVSETTSDYTVADANLTTAESVSDDNTESTQEAVSDTSAPAEPASSAAEIISSEEEIFG